MGTSSLYSDAGRKLLSLARKKGYNTGGHWILELRETQKMSLREVCDYFSETYGIHLTMRQANNQSYHYRSARLNPPKPKSHRVCVSCKGKIIGANYWYCKSCHKDISRTIDPVGEHRVHT